MIISKASSTVFGKVLLEVKGMQGSYLFLLANTFKILQEGNARIYADQESLSVNACS